MRTLSMIDCDSCFKGLKEYCNNCDGVGYLEVKITMDFPSYLSLQYLTFEPVLGLFCVFLLKDNVIGAGNIEWREESLFVYNIQSFKGLYGYMRMIKSMKNIENVYFIEGNASDKELMFWIGAGASFHQSNNQWSFYLDIKKRKTEDSYNQVFNCLRGSHGSIQQTMRKPN